MFDLPRIQIASYLAVAAAIGVVGIGALGSDQGDHELRRPVTAAAGPGGSSSLGGGNRDEATSREPDTESIGGGTGLEIDHRGGSALVVHVAGEVRRPGLYRLPAGARVGAAVRNAGGGTGRAELDGINLAARVVDGQQVVVPSRAPAGGGPSSPTGTAGSAGPVSLGSASAPDLEQIDGIGPVTAEKILEYRDSRGGIGSIEELSEVHGIGPATIDRLRDQLVP